MSGSSMLGGRVSGNREVSRCAIPAVRADVRGAWGWACMEEEEGTWGKHGFPHGSEPKASDEQ